ncbi:MAG: NAD(P)H-dependent oxidoreductase [Planctomycetes bacterium]|nr:NAD(P)H-dependent oxidoreductase [Planctomycetota bacterium]
MSDVLVAYYSHSGNTRAIAECIGRRTGGTVTSIFPIQAYPKAYDAVVEQAKKEIRAGTMPDLAGDARTEPFDVVFVGTPNWWSTMAPPLKTFLSRHDLAGKVVAPFCSHGGGGGHIEQDIRAACPGADVKTALVVSGDGGDRLDSLVEAWLGEIGIPS